MPLPILMPREALGFNAQISLGASKKCHRVTHDIYNFQPSIRELLFYVVVKIPARVSSRMGEIYNTKVEREKRRGPENVDQKEKIESLSGQSCLFY